MKYCKKKKNNVNLFIKKSYIEYKTTHLFQYTNEQNIKGVAQGPNILQLGRFHINPHIDLLTCNSKPYAPPTLPLHYRWH